MARTAESFRKILPIAGLLLVALNLRPAVTGIAPLAERILADGISPQMVGLLTSVPLVLFGVIGLWAGWFGNRFGFSRSLAFGMIVLSFGCLLRTLPGAEESVVTLLGGTILIGAGIAFGNVLLPGFVKSRFPDRIGLLTSLYSTAMNLGAAVGLAFAVPLAARFGGWQGSLRAWTVFGLLAFLVLIPQLFATPRSLARGHPLAGIAKLIRNPRAWQLTAYMGMQSLVFYSTVAWLPTVLLSRGMSETQAAFWVTTMQLIGCVASLVIPTLAGRSDDQRWWAVGCAALIFFSLSGVLWLPVSATIVPVILLGLGLNGAFSIVLLFIALRSDTPGTASNLSSMAQAIGYVLSSPGPWFVGWLHSATASWPIACAAILVPAAITGWLGYLAGRRGTIGSA